MPHPLRTRRWILIHLLTVVAVVTCGALGFWQLDRLEGRRAANARLVAQSERPAVPLDELLDTAGSGPSRVREAEYRTVEVAGRYDSGEQVILQSRGLENRPGNHLLTPLRLDSGEAVVVDRGWVPQPTDDEVLRSATPPPGRVRLTGQLLPSEARGLLGVSDPPPGEVSALPRIDVDRLAAQTPYPLYPLYLRLQSQEPPPGELPEPVPIPPPDDGPHLEYAIQWFLFAGMAAVVYAGLVRRELGRVPAERASGSPEA